MTKYDVIYEALQQQVDEGSLTVEDAELINDVAYEKYADGDTKEKKKLTSAQKKKIVKSIAIASGLLITIAAIIALCKKNGIKVDKQVNELQDRIKESRSKLKEYTSKDELNAIEFSDARIICGDILMFQLKVNSIQEKYNKKAIKKKPIMFKDEDINNEYTKNMDSLHY